MITPLMRWEVIGRFSLEDKHDLGKALRGSPAKNPSNNAS